MFHWKKASSQGPRSKILSGGGGGLIKREPDFFFFLGGGGGGGAAEECYPGKIRVVVTLNVSAMFLQLETATDRKQ